MMDFIAGYMRRYTAYAFPITSESAEFGVVFPATRTTASQAASTDGHAFAPTPARIAAP